MPEQKPRLPESYALICAVRFDDGTMGKTFELHFPVNADKVDFRSETDDFPFIKTLLSSGLEVVKKAEEQHAAGIIKFTEGQGHE